METAVSMLSFGSKPKPLYWLLIVVNNTAPHPPIGQLMGIIWGVD